MTARVPGTTRQKPKPSVYVALPVVRDEWELTAYVALNLIGVVFRHADDCPISELLDPHDP